MSAAATSVQTTVETLIEFHRKGWIKTVEKNDTVYVAAAQRYRAKYILHLRNKMNLTDEQIQTVLSVQQPPYSAAQVEAILKKRPDKSA